MKLAAFIIGAIGILLTVKPFIRSTNWFIRLGDFPRLQVLLLLAAALVLLGVDFDFRNPLDDIFALALLICAAHQINTILPFTTLHRKQVQWARTGHEHETNISLMIFNVLMENDRYDDALRLIETTDADVVMLAEPDKNWEENLVRLNEKYPFRISCPLDNRYGLLLYSRLELHETEVEYLIQDDIPSIHTRVRLRDGRDVALHGVHPRPPMLGENTRSTERDGELLLVGKAVRESDLPVIVAGDLNDVAWSRTTKLFKRISGLLDPRVGRGFYNTFHAHYPFLRVPLDHVFHSTHFRLVSLRRIDDSCGSDHFPVFIELSLEKDAPATQARPVADQAETDEAHEMIGTALAENRFGRLSFRRLREKIKILKQKISRKNRN
jgi:endonuclease/exonuclease/phosphatase (EEP) superfamily protein YafD